MAQGGTARKSCIYAKKSTTKFKTPIESTAARAKCGPSYNKRVSATAAHFGAASGFRPRELRPEARSTMRAQPNSAALKNASVFGAPELRQRAGVVRKPPEDR